MESHFNSCIDTYLQSERIVHQYACARKYFSANKYFQIKVLNPYRVFVDRYERDSVVVGIVGMCITGCLMELWVTLFAECGKAAL